MGVRAGQLTYLKSLVFYLKVAIWDAVANRVAGSSFLPKWCRRKIYQLVGLKVCSSANLSPSIYFQSPRAVIGQHTFVNRGVKFFCGESTVAIGDGVQVAMGATFVTETHAIGPANRRCGDAVSLPILVESGCWIGANAVVLGGVRIGIGCVVAAGAVVNRDCSPNGLYAGVPARRVRDLPVEFPRTHA